MSDTLNEYRNNREKAIKSVAKSFGIAGNQHEADSAYWHNRYVNQAQLEGMDWQPMRLKKKYR